MTFVKEIVAGPTLDQLFSALRNRRSDHVVYFTTKKDGVPKREFFFVEGLNCNPNILLPWKINLVSPTSEERFIAYYAPNFCPGSSIVLDHDMPIVVIGFTSETTRLLLNAGVMTLKDLISKTEMEVVKILVMAELEMRYEMSNEIASRSVIRFEALRDRLDQLGVKFTGERWSIRRIFENL